MSELRAFSPAIRTLSAFLFAGAAIGFTGGCVIVNKQHCGYKESGADNPCPEGYVCSVCAVENNGCVPLDQADAIKDSCLGGSTAASTMTTMPSTDPTDTTLPPTTDSTATTVDPSTTTTETSGTDTTTATDTTSTSTTMSTGTTNVGEDCDPDVVVTDKCDPHYCLPSGVCGTCDDFPAEITCAGLFPDAKTVCAEGGVCAECSGDDASPCPVEAPACVSGMCAPCTEHAQCANACDIHTGMCFPEQERVYYVQGSANCPGLGTQGDPFCNFGLVPLEPGQPTTIKVSAGVQSPGALAVPDNVIVAVVRQGAQLVDINGTNNLGPTIQVAGAQSRVYVYRVNFRFAPTSIIRCQSGAKLWLHESTLAGNQINTARAIDSSGCQLRVVRSLIKECGAGIQATGGDVRVDSSFLFLNGNNNTFGAFNFVNQPKVRIAYSTILQNKDTNTTSVFNCPGFADPWDVSIRNSAVIGVMPMETMGCVIYDGGMKHEAVDVADETATVGSWFTPAPGGLWHPKAGGPLEEQSTWADGDPLLDYYGQPIPQQGMSWTGAVQPP